MGGMSDQKNQRIILEKFLLKKLIFFFFDSANKIIIFKGKKKNLLKKINLTLLKLIIEVFALVYSLFYLCNSDSFSSNNVIWIGNVIPSAKLLNGS